jgi:hypothetical protein
MKLRTGKQSLLFRTGLFVKSETATYPRRQTSLSFAINPFGAHIQSGCAANMREPGTEVREYHRIFAQVQLQP